MLCKFQLPVFKFNFCTPLLFNLTCLEKARELKKKKIYFCFFYYAKAFVCVNHNKLWKILK